MSNAICQTCGEGANLLNGRYCKRLRKYVEHESEPKCNKQSKSSNHE